MSIKCFCSLKSLEGSGRKTPFTLTPTASSRGCPQNTLGLNNLLEVLSKLTESCYTHDYGLLQGEDTDENQPRKEMHRAESGSIPNIDLPDVLFLWIQGWH